MKKRYTEDQIVKIVKGVERSGKTGEACRKYGVSEPTIFQAVPFGGAGSG